MLDDNYFTGSQRFETLAHASQP